jgi:hypothetical protein
MGQGEVAILTGVQHRSQWQRHFVYRKMSLKTTWKLRLALLMLVLLIGSVTREFWMLHIGQSLVCTEEMAPSDIILVENFDPDYLLFERAAALQRAGLAARVLVPVPASRDPEQPSPVFQGIAEVMVRVARMPEPEFLPMHEIEPISLNAAYQIRDFLTKAQIRSILVVTPGFRSQRSSLVYQAVLAPAGIKVYCMPVFGEKTAKNWTKTWHGIQNVTEQWLKLQYYRFYVLWGRLAYP